MVRNTSTVPPGVAVSWACRWPNSMMPSPMAPSAPWRQGRGRADQVDELLEAQPGGVGGNYLGHRRGGAGAALHVDQQTADPGQERLVAGHRPVPVRSVHGPAHRGLDRPGQDAARYSAPGPTSSSLLAVPSR